MELKFGDKVLLGPLLIPSISSFETQISGHKALNLQSLLNEPVSLVSAYDLQFDDELPEAIRSYRKKGGAIFIDSGGYESSRLERYLDNDLEKLRKDAERDWSLPKFKDQIGKVEHDLVASFDVFMEPEEGLGAFKGRLLRSLDEQGEFLGDRMVPVVHVRGRKDNPVLTLDQAVDLIETIARTLDPSFVAIPEREMGEGLISRYNFCRRVVKRLQEVGSETKIHVLGCGNPLSFAVLAHAGVALGDGLEWCRTNCGKDFHLFHFQQFDAISPENIPTPNVGVETFKEYSENKTANSLADNLHAQQDFVVRLQGAIAEDSIRGFLSRHYPLTDEIAELLG